MAVKTWSAGEVLTAADLNDTFGSKLPYSYGTATPSTTDSGFLWYDSNSTPAAPKFWDGAAFQALTSGKILQIVRATDTTDRSTTSTSFVDVTGLSVTITPQKSDSAVILITTARVYANLATSGDKRFGAQITDNSNNALSGAENHIFGGQNDGANLNFYVLTMIAYATPATTSATTYKTRFQSFSASTSITFQNTSSTAQMFAIEVSA